MSTPVSFAAAVKAMPLPITPHTVVVGSSGAGKSFFSALSQYVVSINQDGAIRQLLGSAMAQAVCAHTALGFVQVSEERVQAMSRSVNSLLISRMAVIEDPVDGGQLDVAALLELSQGPGRVALTLRLRCAPKGSRVAEADCTDVKVVGTQLTLNELLAGQKSEWGSRCISWLEAELLEGLETAVATAAERLARDTILALAR